MEKLKATIFKIINEKYQPNMPLLSPSQIASIEKKLLFAFSVCHTPFHPAYSVMIESAIKGLNNVKGSSEELISEYIKGNYEGLPWAHDVYLSHHLRKLCENGEIVLNSTSKCYTTPARAVHQGCKKQAFRKSRWKTKEGMIDKEGKGEGFSSEKNVVQVSENLIGLEEKLVMMVGNPKIKRRRRSLRLVLKDDDQVRGDENVGGSRQNLVVTRSNEALGQGNGDDLIEEWDCVGKVIGDDLSNVGIICDKRGGERIAEEGKACDDSSAAKGMFVPRECVEKSSLKLNTRNIDPEIAVQKSSLKASELMIAPYVRNTVSSGGVDRRLGQTYPMIICGLAVLPKQEQQMSKCSMKKKVKILQGKKKVSSELMSTLPALAVVGNLLEDDQQPEPLCQKWPENKVSGTEIEILPPWLLPMLKGKYFIPCSAHRMDSTKNECNMFCLDCIGDAFCHQCFFQHDKNHRVVQIRKASYRNAVKSNEIGNHIDISHIQTYVINRAKIVFLNTCAEFMPSKGSTRTCEICLQRIDSFRFCSLGCKFYGILQESAQFQELAIDQGQQACSMEQMERHKYLDPPHLSSPEELMSNEDEHNLPLCKVIKKCAKRKRHVVQNPTANTYLATAEALSISATKSQVDLPSSENEKIKRYVRRRRRKDKEAIKETKIDGRERQRKYMEASKEDSILNVQVREQEGVSKLDIYHLSDTNCHEMIQKNPESTKKG